MNSYYQAMRSFDLDFPFITPRTGKRLNKYAIILNEPKEEIVDGERKELPCPLATELLPELLERDEKEDLVQIVGEILEAKILAHSTEEKVSILKPDEIIKTNSPTLAPVMYRLAQEDFAQNDKTTFKIIECRNVTKLISDWKPSLPDKLISSGHQVVVVQLETSFVPYTDFAYAILRQLDFDWKNRLPRSFFFPDDVCKVETTSERDLCVVSPSMPDGDLEINKKMGQLNYELLQMIKTSCMSAMKNYLIKRDLRVGRFSDTLDGVSALRQLYRRLQEKLRSGEAIDLRSSALEDLKKLMKQSNIAGGTDAFQQTWIEYGRRMGLDGSVSKSSSTTSLASNKSSRENRKNGAGDAEGDDEVDVNTVEPNNSTLSSSGFDVDDGKDCQRNGSSVSMQQHDINNNKDGIADEKGSSGSGNKRESDGFLVNTNNGKIASSKNSRNSSSHHQQDSTQSYHEEVYDDGIESDADDEDDADGFKLEDYMEFRNSLDESMHKRRMKMRREKEIAGDEDFDGCVGKEEHEKTGSDGDDEEDDDDTDYNDFTADSIISMLHQVPRNSGE